MNITRRHALGLLSAAGAALASRSLADESPAPSTCTLGFGTYGLPNHSLDEAIDSVAAAGYDSIEICAIADHDADAAKMDALRRREVRDRLADQGLRLTSLMANLRPMESPERHRRDIERLKRNCELAHDLSPNAPAAIQTVLGGKDWNTSRDLCAERLVGWVKVADASDTIVAVKPHRGHAMSRPSEAAWLIAKLGQPKRLKMWFDYSHFAFREMPMTNMVNESLPILAGVAVKDAVEVDGKVRFALPGEAGTIDYVQLLKLLHQGGYRGDICVEVSSQVWKQPGYDATSALEKSYRHLAEAMKQAGVPRP